jgi:hypothetical protein
MLRVQWLHIPNALCILVDAAITAEETHPSNTSNALSDPLLLVLVRFINQGLSLVVAVEVIRDKVVVAVIFNGAHEGRKCTCFAKCTTLDRVKHLHQIGVKDVRAVVVCVAKVLNIFSQVSEEENVVLANLTGDFNLDQVSLRHGYREIMNLR